VSSELELRAPPASREAEEAVLGGLLLQPRAMAKVVDVLQPDDFYFSGHGAVFAELRSAIAELPPGDEAQFDFLTFAERITGTKLQTDWGWSVAELGDLVQHTPSAANVRAYAEIVREHSAKRQLLDVYMRAVNGLYQDRTRSAAEVAAEIQRATLHITARADRGAGLRPLRDYLREWFALLQQRYHAGITMTGLPSPWQCIDALTFGWQPGHLITVGGRPGMGKTIFGWEQAVHAGMIGARTAIFSLEMGGTELAQRAVSSRGRVPWDFLRSPRAWKRGDDDEFWSRTATAVSQLIDSKILIDETPNLTIGQIVSRAERAHMDEPLAAVVLDHLHLTDAEQKTNQNKADALSKVSGGLKGLAKRLNIPVFALAQLNRANTQRVDKRPTMADLRDSGAIEQDSDIVLLLHRPDYYEPPGTAKTHRAEVIIGKGRSLPAGDVVVLKDRYDEMRLEEWGEDGPPPMPEPSTSAPAGRTGGGWGKRGSKALEKGAQE
jgi:replicative DNA helicase